MTEREAVQLLSVMRIAYPNTYKGMDKMDSAATVRMWAMHFAAVPYDIVCDALSRYQAHGKFAPTVADINAELLDMLEDATDILRHRADWELTDKGRAYNRRLAETLTPLKSESGFNLPQKAVEGEPKPAVPVFRKRGELPQGEPGESAGGAKT